MKVAACLIVKDEVRDIAEWLALYRLIGFDTLLVYDNGSTDGTRDVVDAAARQFDVRRTEWGRNDFRSQMDAYEDACRRWGSEFKWIGFFDVDEFLVLHQGLSLNEFLDRSPAIAAVVANWALFGSSGQEEFPSGLIIESFTHRANTAFFPTHHVKSFVRPRSVLTSYNPHFFVVDGMTVDATGSPVAWHFDVNKGQPLPGVTRNAPDYSACQVNHYFVRSRAHWTKKVRRGYPADVAVRTDAEFDVYDRNEVSDRHALRYVDGVKNIAASFALSRSAEA